MKASHDLLERIGELSDAIDRAVLKSQPYDYATRAAYLTGAMHGARDQLRRIFIEVTGDNPWQDAADITGEKPTPKETA